MLNSQCCNPDIVFRNGCTSLGKSTPDLSVLNCRRTINVQNARKRQKFANLLLVTWELATPKGTEIQLANDNSGNPNSTRRPQKR